MNKSSDSARAELPNECDVVMKGGITSGVVYPGAIVQLSKRFRFRNIGGTSAGAIAAAVAGAAEYGRQTGGGTAFGGLEQLPQWLRSQGHLLGLFRPNRRTRLAFDFLMRLLNSPKGENKLYALVKALWATDATLSWLTLTVCVVLAAYAIYFHQWWVLVLAVLLVLIIPIALPAYRVFKTFGDDLPKNFYGMCTGLDDEDADDPSTLTSWLTQFIDQVAGVDKRPDKPLTFGDLWSAGKTQLAADANPLPYQQRTASLIDKEREARVINLEMMTTNLTHGHPYKFPFETKAFYFDPSEFARFFPPRVINWMVNNPRKAANSKEQAHLTAAKPRLPLPEAKDIPIVVAARMSLSFPILISAVPLWAVDWSRPSNEQNELSPTYECCWFSDGGLSSNFPIHLFDSPIPSRPTFGIDLDAFPVETQEAPDESKNVWMPPSNHSGLAGTWTRFEGLGGFFAAILNAMQNWQDNMQSLVPGYRDRIAHIYLDSNEGGMNLNMTDDVLKKLADRGTAAGDLIIRNFDAPNPPNCTGGAVQPTNWPNHRVIRYRNSMSLLEHWVRAFCARYDAGYAALMQRPLGDPPSSFQWEDNDQRAYAKDATDAVIDVNTRLAASGQSFEDGTPRPQPDLATRPRA